MKKCNKNFDFLNMWPSGNWEDHCKIQCDKHGDDYCHLDAKQRTRNSALVQHLVILFNIFINNTTNTILFFIIFCSFFKSINVITNN